MLILDSNGILWSFTKQLFSISGDLHLTLLTMATSSWICGPRGLFTTERTGSFQCCFGVPFECHMHQQGSQNPDMKQQIQKHIINISWYKNNFGLKLHDKLCDSWFECDINSHLWDIMYDCQCKIWGNWIHIYTNMKQ